MPITITKAKPKEILVKLEIVDPSTLEDEALADHYGMLEDQVKAAMMSPIFTQFEEVKKALKQRIKDKCEPTDEIELKGEHWLLEIGKAAKESASIGDLQMTRKFMGEQAFMLCAKVTLTDAKKYLTGEQLDKVLAPAGGYTDRRSVVAKFLG